MQNVSESLAGRCGVITLMTLSADEILTKKKISVTEYIIKGGYPSIHAERGIESPVWYPSYIATYLERDVRNITNVHNLGDFNRLLRALAVRTAKSLSLSDLSRDIGIAPNTAKSWISVLQASSIIRLLEPYFRNMGKRLVKTPKLYFCDTGLLVYLLGIRSWSDLINSPLAGAVWETYAYNQIYRSLLKTTPVSPPLWYWRTSDGHEVDFLIERGGAFTAIEAKLKELPDEGDAASTRKFAGIAGDKALLKGYIISPVRNSFPIDRRITAVNGVGMEL
jgi:predicted AAA+ superfamily ATPase